MTESELAQYHLDKQAKEIAEISCRKAPLQKKIAGINLTVLPLVYHGGIDSELMCEVLDVKDGDSVLDLCTGTGIIALKAAQMGASHVVGTDLNPHAIKNANYNKDNLGLNNIEFLHGSLFKPVKNQKFDVITINPPYTSKKPKNTTEICFWDEDNKTTKDFFAQFKKFLKSNGRVYFAWGNFGSMKLLDKLSQQNKVRLKLLKSKRTPSGLAEFLVYQVLLN